MRALLFPLTFLTVFAISCDWQKNDFQRFIEDTGIDSNVEVVIIIPLDGCNGCVDKSIAFLQSNHDNENIGFIISDHGKKNAMRLGLHDLSPYVVLDAKAEAKKKGYVTSYPVVYYLDNSNINEPVTLDASNVEQFLTTLNENLDQSDEL